MTTLNFKKLNNDAVIPSRATAGSLGYDIHSAVDVIAKANSVTKIPTGLVVSLGHGKEFQIRSRSGLASKGLIVANAPGTIDHDYTGELCILIANLTGDDYVISKGDRIAQGVISSVYIFDVAVVVDIEATERNSGGFGSTGR